MSDCTDCGGTRLPPSIVGVERGTCRCWRPGRIVPHIKLSGRYEYDVEFNGQTITVDPPTLSNAYERLEALRAGR